MSLAEPTLSPASFLHDLGFSATQREDAFQDIQLDLPPRHDLFGINVSATTYDEVVDVLVLAAKHRKATLVDFTPVSVLVEAASDPQFREMLNQFDILCPDGQPVRWCLNRFHQAGLPDRVCGTTTMLRLCEAAAEQEISIYLYGSTPSTLASLSDRLVELYPSLVIAGMESPPFRPLEAHEKASTIRRINDSGAGFVFLGIGSPKQERFAFEHRHDIQAVQLCVGAAYDFIAGTKRRAPAWMQRIGMEWSFRMLTEPRRLGRRYLVGNAQFLRLAVAAGFSKLGT